MKTSAAISRLLVASLLAASVRAADTPPASIEERLRRLEEEVSTLRSQNDELRRRLDATTPPASVTSTTSASPASIPASKPSAASDTPPTPLAVKPAGREQSLALGGFLQAQADFLDKGDSRFTSGRDRFYLRRARIAVTGRFNPEIDFKLDAEMAGSLSDTTGYRGQLMDGFLNWTHFPAASLRVGQFKTPYGYEQLASDTPCPSSSVRSPTTGSASAGKSAHNSPAIFSANASPTQQAFSMAPAPIPTPTTTIPSSA